jgi:sulfate adenylyltransferase subunit 1
MEPTLMSELDTLGVLGYLEQHKNKSLLRVLACGSVDDGKSTLIGRLLHDSLQLYDDHLAALRSDQKGVNADGDLELAMLVDGLQAEREQGITIDVAYRYFSTTARKFILVDSPGHEQYTRNMVTGASHADIAILLIDARYGVQIQTRRHATLCAMLGIRNIAVAVNKMDIVEWSEQRFREIEADVHQLAKRVGITDAAVFPVSALKGDNVVTKSGVSPWYTGPALLPFLETVQITKSTGELTRFPVQYVNRPNLDYRGFSGTVSSGTLHVGDAVTVYPSLRTSTIVGIDTFDGPLTKAIAGDAVTVVLEDEVDISRGDWLVPTGQRVTVATTAAADLVWFDADDLKLGTPYDLKLATSKVPVRVTWIDYRIDVNTGEHHPALTLKMNDIAAVSLELEQALPMDTYSSHPGTGSFILIDRLTNATVAAGLVRQVGAADTSLDAGGATIGISAEEIALNKLIREKYPHWQAIDVSVFQGEGI